MNRRIYVVPCFLLMAAPSSLPAFPQAPPPAPPMGGAPISAQGPNAPGQPRGPQPPGKITGRVLRLDSGGPLLKSIVTLQPEGRFTDQQTARVDRNGAFEFPEVPPGRYRITAQRNGFVPQVFGQRGGGPGVIVEVQSRQAVDKILFNLERGGVITGTVLDEDNEPVEGVDVRAQRVRFLAGGRQRALSMRTARTDDLGNFRLTGLTPGTYYVQAAGRGDGPINFTALTTGIGYVGNYYPGVATREEAQRVPVTAGNETRRIDFSLRAANTYSIIGIVVDPAPPAGSRNYLAGMARTDFQFFSMVNEEGKFTLRGLEPGDYMVFAAQAPASGGAASDGPRRGYRKVTISDSDVQVAIELGKSATIAGEVKQVTGEALPARLFLQLRSDEEGTPNTSFQIADGKFKAENVADGLYTFTVNDPTNSFYLKEARCAGEDYTDRRMLVTLETKVDDCQITVAKDVGQATITIEREGKPAEGSLVVFLAADAEKRKNPRFSVLGQTASTGIAQVRGIVPGEYLVYALMPMDDASYYDLEFVARNRDTAASVTVRPNDQQTLALKVITPK